MSTLPLSLSHDRSVPRSLARPRAHLITLSTRDRSPLLIVDPRAGSLVDRHVRTLHRPDLSVLAWSITADQVLVLVARSGSSRIVGTARRLRDLTAARLTALGHTRPWAIEVPVLSLRPHHDLATLVEYVLAAPVRAGLADGWPGWRWAGSLQWPTVCREFLARHPSDLLWLDAATGDIVGERTRAPGTRRPPGRSEVVSGCPVSDAEIRSRPETRTPSESSQRRTADLSRRPRA